MLDIELYDSVRTMFDEAVVAEGRAFTRDLAVFRILNRARGFLAKNLPPTARHLGGRAWRALRRREAGGSPG